MNRIRSQIWKHNWAVALGVILRMALRGRRAIQARQELTGHRGLMVRRVTRGLLALTGHQRMMSLWQMDLSGMRQRGWRALSGQRARQEQRERRVIQVLLAQQE